MQFPGFRVQGFLLWVLSDFDPAEAPEKDPPLKERPPWRLVDILVPVLGHPIIPGHIKLGVRKG